MAAAPALVGAEHRPGPLGRAREVADALAALERVAQRPAGGEGQLELLGGGDRGRLVEPPQPLVDPPLSQSGDPLLRQPDRLQVGDPELAAEPHGLAGGGLDHRRIGAGVAQHVGLDELQPAVLGARRDALEQPPRPLQPPDRDGLLAAEVEVVRGEPQRGAGGADVVARRAERPEGPLAGREGRRLVGQPPRRPAQALPGGAGVRVVGHRALELLPRLNPVTAPQCRISDRLGHAADIAMDAISVIGAGLVGLATARELLARGHAVTVYDAAPAVAAHQSSRNSGVVHAGIYYAPGSLKARLAVEGSRLLYEYCEQRGVPFRRCGKLIVATDRAQLPALEELERRGRANGVPDLKRVAPDEIEPHVRGVAALHSPHTGVVDFGDGGARARAGRRSGRRHDPSEHAHHASSTPRGARSCAPARGRTRSRRAATSASSRSAAPTGRSSGRNWCARWSIPCPTPRCRFSACI